MQSEADSIADADMEAETAAAEEEEAEVYESEEVEEGDGLNGDTVWDPDHATPWRPRRSRRNTSQLTARRPSRLLPEKVHKHHPLIHFLLHSSQLVYNSVHQLWTCSQSVCLKWGRGPCER